MTERLHDGELPIDLPLVRRLLAEQHPSLAHLPLAPVPSTGTVNVVLRLGDALCVRLPRLAEWAPSLEREVTWLPRLAGRLPLRIPEVVAAGLPSAAYPLPWAILTWIDGVPYADEVIANEARAAQDLAGFVLALRALPVPDDAPSGGRRPLPELDAATRVAIATSPELDQEAVLAAWEEALATPPNTERPVWVHTDLLRPNLLAARGRLRAVVDFGAAGVGDPAADVIAAWAVFGPAGRAAYRAALGVDDGTWARARGYALHQAVEIVPYYRQSHPEFARLAVRTVHQVLADLWH